MGRIGIGIVILLMMVALTVALRPWLAVGSENWQPAVPVLRLHIIANSDSPEDQSLKLEVKAAVEPYLRQVLPSLLTAATPGEALAIAARHRQVIERLVQEVLERLGSPYDVEVGIGQFPYDGRYYGDLWLPPGRYPSIQIRLGQAAGSNWWCILFAPVCAVPPSVPGDPGAEETAPDADGGDPVDYSLFLTPDGSITIMEAASGSGEMELRWALWDWLNRRFPRPVMAAGENG